MDGSRAPMASAGIETGGEGRNSPASPKFPVGLRVLVVDDDANYLKIMERMLHHCLYNVTSCTRAAAALSILRERKGGFDIVLSDVHMPDMDGFKLLELIGLEMDLPVIMVSADDNKDVVMKGVTHGACDYLIKPVRMNALKNIWQHVIRKKRSGSKEFEHSGSTEDDDKQKRPSDEVENASSPNEGNSTNVKRKKEGKEEEGDVEEQEDYSAQKKPRVVWSSDLHQSFVTAVDQLGIEKAVPTKILDLMNKPWLTRENVASHLQKYRLYLRRVCGPQYQGQSESPFMGDTDSGFGFGNSLDGFDLQSLGVPAQFPSQRLTTANAGSRTYANVDQISFCNSDVQVVNSPRMRSSAGQLLSNKQFGFLWGASSNIGSSLSQQSSQSFGDMGLQATKGTSDCLNLSSSARTNFLFPGTNVYGQLGNGYGLQMTPQGQYTSLSHQQNNIQIGMQYQPRLRGLTGSHNSTVPSLLPAYQNVAYGAVPQAQYADFSSCRNHDAGTGSYCPLVSSIGAPNRTFAGKVEAMSDTMSSKGVNDSIHSHDLHNELCRSKSQKWELHNSNLPYESTQSLGSKQTNGDFGSAITNLSYSNDHGGRKEEISVGTETERKVGCISQHINTVPIEDNVGVKHESIPYSNCLDELFAENFPPDMAIMRIQDQEGFAQCESEFNFSCSLDDIEV